MRYTHQLHMNQLRRQMQMLSKQLEQTNSMVRCMQEQHKKEKEKLVYENRILKKGVAIQDQKIKEKDAAGHALQQSMQVIMTRMQELQNENDRLRAELGSYCTSSVEYLSRFPPGVH